MTALQSLVETFSSSTVAKAGFQDLISNTFNAQTSHVHDLIETLSKVTSTSFGDTLQNGPFADLSAQLASLTHGHQIVDGFAEGSLSELGAAFAPEVAQGLVEHLDFEIVEDLEISDEIPQDLLPFHEQVLRFVDWAECNLPRYWESLVQVLNKLAAICLFSAWVGFFSSLPLLFGVEGFFASLALQGTVRAFNEEMLSRLSATHRLALDAPCPHCGAFAGYWCITLRGYLPGSRAEKMHRERVKAASRRNQDSSD